VLVNKEYQLQIVNVELDIMTMVLWPVLYVTSNVLLVKMEKNVLLVVEIEKKHLIVQFVQLAILMMDLV